MDKSLQAADMFVAEIRKYWEYAQYGRSIKEWQDRELNKKLVEKNVLCFGGIYSEGGLAIAAREFFQQAHLI
jgi:hypothetical protein